MDSCIKTCQVIYSSYPIIIFPQIFNVLVHLKDTRMKSSVHHGRSVVVSWLPVAEIRVCGFGMYWMMEKNTNVQVFYYIIHKM